MIQSSSSSPALSVFVRSGSVTPGDGCSPLQSTRSLLVHAVNGFAHQQIDPTIITTYFAALHLDLSQADLSLTLNTTLNLTDTETKIHSLSELPEEAEEDAGEEPSAFLTIKLLTNRHFNEDAFKNCLHQMWPSINVLVKEPNFFTIEFSSFGDYRRVLIGQPWHFDYKLMVMTPLKPDQQSLSRCSAQHPFGSKSLKTLFFIGHGL
ncbi:hypothetical protein F8388_011456 [Cannabis sativa]|uniref:DUF4283 domain-containing protein n=1 Tax=Cannabis sativa TaxID=3483 RepID=A0A7J6DUD0_CANSA|nr:hypothetical protein G4B88_023223 [Cannabis sativa]KAF4377703.1 hypothetical protein F8388_011456 [Cannabis sativa]